MSDHIVGCHSCGHNNLDKVLDLGYQPLCNEFWPSNEPAKPQIFYPLCLNKCVKCSLVQLSYVIPTSDTFGEQYTYLTGSSQSLINYYANLALILTEKFSLKPDDTILEIGSNDGTFLSQFQTQGMNVIGVEGAKIASELANRRNITTLAHFFGKGSASDIRKQLPNGSNIRVILAMNVLAHTDNINEFLSELVALMDENTVFISQSHWLIELIKNFEFDTIYHEHLRYYTLESLRTLFNAHGIFISHAESNDFYGGSILVEAALNQTEESCDMAAILAQEREIDITESLTDMKSQIMENRNSLLDLLLDLKRSGKRVVGIGAPMKSSTFLNLYGINNELIEYLAEVNELKVGTLVPGVRIPVEHERTLFDHQPDYAMLLSWNMAEFIIPKYRELGYTGKFILPIPSLEIIE